MLLFRCLMMFNVLFVILSHLNDNNFHIKFNLYHVPSICTFIVNNFSNIKKLKNKMIPVLKPFKACAAYFIFRVNILKRFNKFSIKRFTLQWELAVAVAVAVAMIMALRSFRSFVFFFCTIFKRSV